MKERKKLPESTKRLVRQRCGFGCVRCAYPLIQYHHITPWADTQNDSAENLVLLCRRCHGEYHDGLISDGELKGCIEAPAALAGGDIQSFMCSPKEFAIEFGSMKFSNPIDIPGAWFSPFAILGKHPVYFRVQDRFPLLNLEIYNCENQISLKIVDNEVVFDRMVYDVVWVRNRLTVNFMKRFTILDVTFGEAIRINEALWVVDQHLVYSGTNFHYMNKMSTFSNCAVSGFPVGVAIGKSQPCGFWDVPVFFEYPDVKDWVKASESPMNVGLLNQVVSHFGLPRDKRCADDYDKEVFRKCWVDTGHGLPDWLSKRGYAI